MLKETLCFISMLFGHHHCHEEKALPVKSISGNQVLIAHAHAGNERGKAHIVGTVEKAFSAGTVSSHRNHLDITVTQNGKVIQSMATTFFPMEIPATRQGIRGRSIFNITTGELPPDAEITVAVHGQPIHVSNRAPSHTMSRK